MLSLLNYYNVAALHPVHYFIIKLTVIPVSLNTKQYEKTVGIVNVATVHMSLSFHLV